MMLIALQLSSLHYDLTSDDWKQTILPFRTLHSLHYL